MAIQKMMFLKIAGSVEDMHEVLKRLVLSESLQLDFDNSDVYDNSYIIHKYETVMTGSSICQKEDLDKLEAQCGEVEQKLELLGGGLSVVPRLNKELVMDASYNIWDAAKDINELLDSIGPEIDKIKEKKAATSRYEQFREKLQCIYDKELDFDTIAGLNYFDYEIGALSNANKLRLRRNYENISAIVLNIGNINNSVEDLDIIIFPRKFRDETSKLLRSLNWVSLDIPEKLHGTVNQLISETNDRISALRGEVRELSKLLDDRKEKVGPLLDKIYTECKLERKILSIEREVTYGESTFVMSAWSRKDDRAKIEKVLEPVKKKNNHRMEKC